MFIPSIEDQSGSLGHAIAIAGARGSLDPHQTDVILRAPSRGALALSVGFLTAAIVGCAGLVLAKAPWATLFFLPLFVGAVVGLCSADHPVRGSLLAVLAAMLLFIVCCGVRYGLPDTLWGAALVSFSLPLVVPETIIGALCTATIRRYLRGRRAHAAFLARV